MDQQHKGGKPKLDPEGQMAFLRDKGVAFERMGEADAMRHLVFSQEKVDSWDCGGNPGPNRNRKEAACTALSRERSR